MSCSRKRISAKPLLRRTETTAFAIPGDGHLVSVLKNRVSLYIDREILQGRGKIIQTYLYLVFKLIKEL